MAKAKTSITTENRSGSAADAAAKEQRTEMLLSDLHPFEGHPFKVLDDELMLLAAMATKESSFYYCDEHFSCIQSDIEKRIFGIMLDRIRDDEQLIFTTHNTDMLDLNLPKHSYVFLRKHLEEGVYQVSAVSASDVLKRNTDSLRCAVENDVFASLPQDSLLDELEMGY